MLVNIQLCEEPYLETRKLDEYKYSTRNIFGFAESFDVSFLCVCPVIDHELRHNIVKVAVDEIHDQ